MKLTVLAGAKEGTVIPLKKSEFVIGRSSECSLRAGSDAISRRHCVITRQESLWTVRDMGSRNGTYVNDVRIDAETPLKPGDELRVGPLKFRVDLSHAPAGTSASAKPQGSSQSSTQAGSSSRIKTSKQVEPAADPHRAADSGSSISASQGPGKPDPNKPSATSAGGAHSAGKTPSDSDSIEDDISQWLIGPAVGGRSTRETQSLKLDDTRAVGIGSSPTAANEPEPEWVEAGETDETAEMKPAAPEASDKDDAAAKKSWSLFSKGGKQKPAAPKKSAGKLPSRPAAETKDSREAAADVLREMTRRR